VLPTDVALAARDYGRDFTTNGDEENVAKMKLVLLMIQYPECDLFIRSMFWKLIDEGKNIATASRLVVLEMQNRRSEIIVAREIPQQQKLDNLTEQVARLEAENAHWDRVRNCILLGVPTAGLAAIGGWAMGIAGAVGGGVAGFFLPSSLRRFFGGEG
jgi:hypothetical protein